MSGFVVPAHAHRFTVFVVSVIVLLPRFFFQATFAQAIGELLAQSGEGGRPHRHRLAPARTDFTIAKQSRAA
jgi:hypothetical protein